MRRVALFAALVAIAGCDSNDGSPAGERSQTEHSPAQAGNSPERTAHAYVEALSGKDGRRFCELLAPYVAGTLDLAARSYWGARLRGPGCPRLVEKFTGRDDDPRRRWRRADVLDVGAPRAQGALTVVELRLRHRYAGGRARVEPDRLYLARFGGDWRVAKLSAVAERARLAGFTRDTPDGPPDLRAEQARYAQLRDKYVAQQRRERGTFHTPGRLAQCRGPGRHVADSAGDVAYQSGPPQPVPEPEADIRSATLVTTTRVLCLTVELARRPRGRLFMQLWTAGHAPITADRREDGVWRTISGEDERDHPQVIDATVGQQGRRVSLRVRRGDRAGRFQWGVMLLTPDMDAGQMLVDRVPDG
jgi:hypothetical protein